ncbi:hypothetical protein FO440_20845 [Mucilaginibacter corticis]|uniref:Lipoprotein n=1 Tax=Mucilaginibacter corticis TaxID=2597670 RepID=A0A556MBN7_9SPHI|nr:hypothetical protein [Mucilaginibacter corticis]TSJ37215.1 hypothetical protein FO440_20845 [Mucilaginibacter corticis]
MKGLLMKNCIYSLLFVLVIVSCKNKTTQRSENDTAKKSVKKSNISYQNPLFSQYVDYLKSQDIKVAASNTNAIKKFVELFKGKDARTCDTAFLIYNKFYKKMTESLEDVNEKDSIDLDVFYTYKNGPKNIPPNVIDYVKNLRDNGFDILEEEGSVYVTQDWDFVAKYYYDLVSPSMKEFLQEINIESKQLYLEDGSITIAADTLVDRAAWWEQFETKHANFIWKDEVLATKKEYLNVLLRGSDNTEIFYDRQLNEYFKKAYLYLEKKYPGTETYKLAKPVYELLIQGKKTEADNVLEQYDKRGLLLN